MYARLINQSYYEKDGIQANLAWLTILAHKDKNSDHFVPVEEIITQNWQQFGRYYYPRYYQEQVDLADTNKMMERLRFVFRDGSRIIFKLNGTGSVGATIKFYFEQFKQVDIQHETATPLANIIKLGLEQSDIANFTGRNEPNNHIIKQIFKVYINLIVKPIFSLLCFFRKFLLTYYKTLYAFRVNTQ